MVRCPGDGHPPGTEAFELEQVRRRLHRLVEQRFVGGLDQDGEAEFVDLSRREQELLSRD
jgi:hypothetical protein